MKLQKNMIWLSGIVSVLALFAAIILNSVGESFWCNICIGLFSSGVLIFVSSIAAYYSERNKEVFLFYEGCYTFLDSLVKYVRINNRIDIYELQETLDHSTEVYHINVYYHMCEIKRINKYAKIRKLSDAVWEKIRHIYLCMLDDKDMLTDFILGDVMQDEIQEYSWKIAGDEVLQYVKELHAELDKLACHMDYYNKKHQKEVPDDAD